MMTKEEKNQLMKEYYKNNPEAYRKHLEVCKKWYYKNKEKDLKKGYVWKMENREKVRLKEKLYRINNKEEYLKKAKEKRLRNIKNSLIRSITNYHITKSNKCDICGSKENLQSHHWNYDKPLLVNTLCGTCHTIQHIKNFDRWHQAKLEADRHLEVAY